MALLEPNVHVERYRFNSFDKDEPEQAAVTEKAAVHFPVEQVIAPELPPPPTYSEGELTAAKKASYLEGLNAGKQEAEAKINKATEENAASTRNLLEVIANRITLASESHAQELKNQQEVALKLSIAIARKIAGDALKREPYASVESLLKECTGLIGGQERIVISVSPQKSEGLRQSAESLKPYLGSFEGEVVVEEDAALAENDCRIEWKNGHASRTAEHLWQEIETLLKNTVLTS